MLLFLIVKEILIDFLIIEVQMKMERGFNECLVKDKEGNVLKTFKKFS